ncbi:C10 family peptidase [uncultured Apibacter sp.]|uniref:C10 family peptidase n=1 Tax=uncultured Apibacter sp. TaxID=1778616 RepID=UPI0025EE0981|nr:C10 family peptidase [uncultured Apibacter sp.]
MNLKSILLGIAIFISYLFHGQDISEKTARIVANNFLNQKNIKKTSNNEKLINITARIDKKYDGFYIFNSENGFFIISSQSENHPILAYSLESSIPVGEKQSPEFLYILNEYQAANEYLRNNKIKKINDDESILIKEEWNALLNGRQLSSAKNNTNKSDATDPAFVLPLIKTKWKQRPLYNKLVPKTYENYDCPTGCVATAMAQLMKYWGYPKKGMSNHTYKISSKYYDWNGKTLSANFENTTYKWSNMPTSLDDSSSKEEVDAVATLMLHAGISVDMIYGPNSSGAYSSDVPNALVKYFRYNSDLDMESKIDYDNTEWIKLIKSQLSKNYPIYYKGSSSKGGHAFIADGYDTDNLIHFNFGWGGKSDGYYQASNPVGYTSKQAIIINIYPGEDYCSKPSGLSTSNLANYNITLNWKSISGVENYTVEYKANTDTTWKVATTTANASYTLTGLRANTSYDWRVKANCSSENSSDYAQDEFKTLSDCSTPEGLKASYLSTNSALLNWKAIPNVQNYTIEYKANNDTQWNIAATTSENYYTLSGLKANTSYNWRVKANCSSESSSSYIQNEFTTLLNDVYNYEPNNSFDTAYPIDCNITYSAGIDSRVDVDYYKFTITKVSNIIITLQNLPKNYDLVLYDSDKNYIASSTRKGKLDEFIVLDNLEAGTYYVYVYGYKNAYKDKKCYDLTVYNKTPDKNINNVDLYSDLSNEKNKNSIVIYPNPVTDIINIKGIASDLQKSTTVTIHDRNGNVVKTLQINIEETISINVSDLPPNHYFLQIQSKIYRFIKK